jgi:DinB superfamily
MSELEQRCNEFEEVAAQARDVTEGLNEKSFNLRPGPDQWSIEECLAHLLSAGNERLRAIEAGIDAGRAAGITGVDPFRYGPFDRYMMRIMEPPANHRFKSPRRFRPLHEQPLTGVMPSFYHLQRQLILQTKRAEGLDLKRIKIPTPIAGFVRISLGATFAMIAAHERRHLEQARRVRRMLPG